ncbi:four-carbon acid sugar kinase family protein [Mucilaginibacter mali]|uniref:Four-carbon acid sugar kinase family protein n=1 Tax=Mucilaginibacter mali TaxID=2740462 RepID=A0A7D4TQI1_9SPHI|nr:four-carbon acid sugar kinase family protein [Mucilaginibacter mali]QKJ31374.1 four-carbon acid sugar kinase family protein [Mucilaginibacter mali]
MIAVIADDLTGAAELAGIGLQYQLKTEIEMLVDAETDADLLIIATDTRAMTAEEAKATVSQITRQLMALKPRSIFKKIDSVLRGHVVDEVMSQMEASGLQSALIVAGNPSHNKTIVDGVYYYEDQPVHLSNFANDPCFPAISSDVKTILRTDDEIHVLKQDEPIPVQGISIGEIAVDTDFDQWVAKAGADTLLAGSAGLFESLLKHLQSTPIVSPVVNCSLKSARLFVLGSTFNKDNYQVIDGLLNNTPVVYLPDEIIFGDEIPETTAKNYVEQVVSALSHAGSCVMAIHPEATTNKTVDPVALTHKMGLMVKRIGQNINLHQILIEGGATATAVLQHLGITKLVPLQQLSPGVICTSIPGNNQLNVTLKPGSYPWPPGIWQPTN